MNAFQHITAGCKTPVYRQLKLWDHIHAHYILVLCGFALVLKKSDRDVCGAKSYTHRLTGHVTRHIRRFRVLAILPNRAGYSQLYDLDDQVWITPGKGSPTCLTISKYFPMRLMMRMSMSLSIAQGNPVASNRLWKDYCGKKTAVRIHETCERPTEPYALFVSLVMRFGRPCYSSGG